MEIQESETDPFKLLVNMRDGCVDITEDELSYFGDENDEPDDDGSDYVLDSGFDKVVYKKKPTSNRSAKSGVDHSGLTFEEQKETEEPIEIDLRNIHTAYGINPVENRTKRKLKKDNNLVTSAVGEAYLKFVYGKQEEAINLLFELIRMDPLSPEPYEALGDIYHKMGNYQKALEFYILGIEFNKEDSKRWADLAEIALLNNMYKSALEFYNKAIKLSPRNITYHIRKLNLLEELKQYENALKTCEKILSFLEPDDYRVIFSIAFRMANLLHHMNRPTEAVKMIENVLAQQSAETDKEKFESFRFYLPTYFELLLADDKHQKVVLKFIQYDLVKLTDELMDLDTEDQKIEAILNSLKSGQINFQENIVLNSKLACAWLYLTRENVAQKVIDEYEEVEDAILEMVYRSIIPLLIRLGHYDQAYRFVSKLVNRSHSSKYWYWHGFCLAKLSREEEAVTAYENAIKYDPNNYEAINELSDLCNKIGIPERALECVQLDQLKVDCRLLLNRCNLLFICKRWPEFISHTRLLLGANIYFLENLNDIKDLIVRHSYSLTGLLRYSKTLRRRFTKKKTNVQLAGAKLTKEQFFEYWKKSIFVLLNYVRDRDEAVCWALSGLLSDFCPSLFQPTLLIIFRTCIDAKFTTITYDVGKLLIREFRNSGKIWYAFSVMMSNIYQDCRHKRLCIRMWLEASDNVNVLLMNAHIAFSASRYIHAMGIYLTVYRMRTPYRYDSFHVALTYMHLICQPHTLDKCSLFSQMICFFNDYMQKIGKCQETYYNLARAFHQLGFTRYAIELYQAALHTPLKVHDKRFDLSPEIAFNLAQIYRHSGDHRKANQLIYQYCTI